MVQWSPKSDGTGATLNVHIRSDNAAFTGTYECNGDIASGGSRIKEMGSVCGVNPPVAAFCTYVAPEPPVVNEAFCSYSGSSYSLTSIPGIAWRRRHFPLATCLGIRYQQTTFCHHAQVQMWHQLYLAVKDVDWL